MNDHLHDLIEKSARDQLSPRESAELKVALAEDAELRQLHEDALASRAIFERAPRPACPDELRDRILSAVDEELERKERTYARGPMRSRRPWVWGAVAVAAAIVLALVLPDRIVLVPNETEPQLSEAEIEELRAEVGLAFSLVSHAMNRSGEIIDREIRDNVSRPIFEHIGGPPSTPADDRQSWLISPPRSDC